MSTNYDMWYCLYDPDNYRGHKRQRLRATDPEAAAKEAEDLLAKSFNPTSRPWEYWVFEVTGVVAGPKLWPPQ